MVSSPLHLHLVHRLELQDLPKSLGGHAVRRRNLSLSQLPRAQASQPDEVQQLDADPLVVQEVHLHQGEPGPLDLQLLEEVDQLQEPGHQLLQCLLRIAISLPECLLQIN